MDIDRLIEEAYEGGVVEALIDEKTKQVSDLSDEIKRLVAVHAQNRTWWRFAESGLGQDLFSVEERALLKSAQEKSGRELRTKTDEQEQARNRLEAFKAFAPTWRKKVVQN